MDMTPQAWPDWYDGRHINEVLFCRQFLDKHQMCIRDRYMNDRCPLSVAWPITGISAF